MSAVGDIAQALTGGGGMSEADSNNLANLSQNSAGFLQGINESKTVQQKTLGYVSDIAVDVGTKGWFAETLGKLVKFEEAQQIKDEEAQKLSETMNDILSDMNILEEDAAADRKKNKSKKGKVSDRAKLDDLKQLPYEYATLGAVLAAALNKKDDKKEKKGGIAGFFKGLLEGVAGIAALGVALLVFAGAMLIFNFVDWGKAIVGLLAFTVFTIGMVALAKVLGKEEKNLTQFAQASLTMSAALGVFAVSLYLVAAVVGSSGVYLFGKEIVPPFKFMNAIEGIGLFLAFELGLVLVAKALGKSNGDILKFAQGSLFMAAALGVFGISLYIVSAVVGSSGVTIAGKEILPAFSLKDAIVGTALFLAFELGLAVVARVAGSETGNFVKFALGSIVMCGALVAFAFSLVIVSKVLTEGVHLSMFGLNVDLPAVDMAMAIAGVGMFLVFMLGMGVLASAGSSLIANMAILAGVSILMSVSLIAFSFAMLCAGIAVQGGKADMMGLHFDVPEKNGWNAIGALAVMGAFMLAFAGLGALFLVPFAGAALAAGILIASGILLSIGATVIVMAKAMALAGLITTGGEMEWEGKKFTMVPMDESKIDAAFDPFYVLMDKVVEMGNKIKGQSSIFPWKSKPGADIGAIRMVGSVAEVVAKVAECIAESMTVKKKVEDAGATWDVHVIDGCMDYMLLVVDRLVEVTDKMGWFTGSKLKVLTDSMLPIVEVIDKLVDTIKKALTMKKDLEDRGVKFVGSGIDPEILNGICDPVIQILMGPNMDGSGGLVGAADSLGYFGAAALEKVTKSMLPVAQTIALLVDSIEKAANLGGEGGNAKALIDQGVENMKYLMVGDGQTETSGALWWKKETITGGFVGLFNTIAQGVETIGDVTETINSMKTLANAVAEIMEAFAKMSGIDVGDVSTSVDKFGRVLGKKSKTSLSFSWWDGFSVSKESATGMMAIIELMDDLSVKDIKSATGSMTELKSLITATADVMSVAGTLTSQDFGEIADIPDLNNFVTQMKLFDKGMKSMASAYERAADMPKKWLSNTAIAMHRIGSVNLDNLDRLAVFSEKYKALNKTAEALENVAKSMNKISKAEAIGSMTDKIGSIFGLGNDTPKTTSTAPSAATQTNTSSIKIEQILRKWDEEGIKIKQNLEAFEDSDEKPQPVDLLSV